LTFAVATPVRRGGFTLVELLLGILLLASLGTALSALVWSMLGTRDRVSIAVTRGEEWSRLVSIIEEAVLSCDAEGAGGFFEGGQTMLRVPCRAITAAPGTGHAVSTNAVLGLDFDAQRRMIILTRGQDTETAMQGVSACTIRFWNGRAWSESFRASGVIGLPAAVELCVWFTDDQEASGSSSRSPDCWRIFAVPDGLQAMTGGDP